MRDRALRAAAWSAGLWLLWRLPPPGADGDPGADRQGAGRHGAPPRLTVVIPARNEERSLPTLLASLSAQRRPADELIVVDDHSTDRTAALAAEAGATVVASGPLPDGWTGKTWACHQGAAAAGGDLLLFVDADVRLAPDALARLQREHATYGGLVSVQPFHRTERPYERLSAIANVVVLMGTGAFTGPPHRPPAMAFGPCLLLGRDDYDRIGGHAHPAVRPLVAEDIGLARRCRAEGRPVRVVAGREVVAFRMYPEGPAQLVEGWTKGLAYGARHTSPLLAALVGLWVTGAGAAAVDGARGAAGLACRRPGAAAALGWYGLWAAQIGWMLRRVGRFGPATAVAYPVPLAAFVALCARSGVLRGLRRAPQWRGRRAPRA